MSDINAMRELFAEKARDGEGAFAIAWALLELADAQTITAKAVNKLGVGEASTHLGALEALQIQVGKVADALDGIGSAITEHAMPDVDET